MSYKNFEKIGNTENIENTEGEKNTEGKEKEKILDKIKNFFGGVENKNEEKGDKDSENSGNKEESLDERRKAFIERVKVDVQPNENVSENTKRNEGGDERDERERSIWDEER